MRKERQERPTSKRLGARRRSCVAVRRGMSAQPRCEWLYARTRSRAPVRHRLSARSRTIAAITLASLAAVTAAGPLAGGADAQACRAHASSVVQIHLKIFERGRTLIVNLTGPGNRKVLVVYKATVHGKQLETGQKVVALVDGKRTATFELSKHAAEDGSISVKASFVSEH